MEHATGIVDGRFVLALATVTTVAAHKPPTEGEPMKKLQILGTGCPKCKALAANTEAAAQALGLEYELVKVTDINQIMDFGVMMTPALAVEGVVKASGKVLSPDEIKKLIQ
jgi:small redox-active disulfide protein 2